METTQGDRATLIGCCVARDFAECGEVAHRLKGDLETLGCSRAAHVAGIIHERVAMETKGGQGEDWEREVRWLVRLLNAVMADSQRALDEMPLMR